MRPVTLLDTCVSLSQAGVWPPDGTVRVLNMLRVRLVAFAAAVDLLAHGSIRFRQSCTTTACQAFLGIDPRWSVLGVWD
jgi:hypothetical protein